MESAKEEEGVRSFPKEDNRTPEEKEHDDRIYAERHRRAREKAEQENAKRTPEQKEAERISKEKIKDLTMAINRELFLVSKLEAAIATIKNVIRLLELQAEPNKDPIAAIKEHVRGLEENLRLTVEKIKVSWGMRHEEHMKAGTREECFYE